MGNGYHHQNLHIHKSTFLPMLCSRPSIKDVALPKWEDRSTSINSNDPLSPKIGCMGQVKRTNKIVGFPTSHKLTITARSNNNVKYFKLKKLFSGKNLTANTNITTTGTSCYRRREVSMNGVSSAKVDREDSEVCINIIDMDPPLPVIKKAVKPEDKKDENNLWRRRSAGGALKSLQLQHIQIPRHRLEITTV